MVGRLREGLAELFHLPDGYEVVLGNGGATAFWDAAAFGLIERASQHLSFGEFSSKFARAVTGAPHLDPPQVIESVPGTHPSPVPSDRIDVYALTHNETSTGVTMPVTMVEAEGLTVVDATSAAGGIPVDPAQFDVYYFSPQKAFGGDGGLYVALCSPKAVERIEQVAASGRWMPPFLSLAAAVSNSRKDQTYNTPALATIYLLTDTVEWINGRGGLTWSAQRCARNADILYGWARCPFHGRTLRRRSVHPVPCYRHHRLRTAAVRRPPGRHAAGQRGGGHGVVPEAGTQPTADRVVADDPPLGCRSPDRLYRLRDRGYRQLTGNRNPPFLTRISVTRV